MAAIFMLVATTLITVGMKLVSTASRQAKQQGLYIAEAESIAKAGLRDATDWFGRQTANNGIVSELYVGNGNVTVGQAAVTNVSPNGSLYTYPDQAFWPQNNTFNGQSSDTLEPWIGIVNEYPLDSGVTMNALYFARYEVRKIANPVGLTPAPTWDPYAVHDISGQRTGTDLVNGDGTVWSIVSTGYVYKRMDKTINPITGMWNKEYNVYPNVVVASARYCTELKKLSLSMPTTDMPALSGAVYCQSASQITLNNNTVQLSNGAVSTQGVYAVIEMNP